MPRSLLLAAAAVTLAACVTPAAADAALLPFPDDKYTVPADTPTGRQVALPQDQMPKNRLGKPIDVTDLNRADGFSPGQPIVVQVPGLDNLEAYRRTGAAPIDDPQRSLRRDAPVQVLDATTGARHLVWAELDLNATSDAKRALIIRPAVNFEEGRRYVVALQRLRDARGRLIGPAAERPDAATHKLLRRAGVATGNQLHRAWSFTVASAQSTTGRMLAIRDATFAELGDTNLADRKVEGRAPTFTINPDLPDSVAGGVPGEVPAQDGITEYADGPIERKVRGKLTVPCFLNLPGCPTGSQFLIGADGAPQRLPGNTTVYDFTCNIPRREGKLRPGLYGHGLFGGQGEIDQGQLKDLSFEHGFLFCAVDWNGMATKDVPNAVTVLQDVSRFPTLVDHVQQGYLGFLLLGRAMIHPDGLSSHPAFEGRIDTSELYYDGNSQGGIYGGALTAIAPDFERAVLGVPGMNYSTLLQRSVDFDMYAQGNVEGVETPLGLYDNYPDELDRQLVFGFMQMLWDRADPNGYAHHMTSDPLPNTPSHEVLMHVGFGDHQVADVSAEVQARTIGARIHRPGLAADRPRYSDRPYPDEPAPAPFQGIDSLGAPGYSADGSGIVFWDTRKTPPPPAGNVPPREGEDPHEMPRRSAAARRQKDAFLRPDGKVIDVCGGPCGA
jgi:hypothetical protein